MFTTQPAQVTRKVYPKIHCARHTCDSQGLKFDFYWSVLLLMNGTMNILDQADSPHSSNK